MASVLGDIDIPCSMCGERITVAVRSSSSHETNTALVVEMHIDARPFQAHPCVLNAQHAEWSDEMDNSYPAWP